jgi:hypothetical protein
MSGGFGNGGLGVDYLFFVLMFSVLVTLGSFFVVQWMFPW